MKCSSIGSSVMEAKILLSLCHSTCLTRLPKVGVANYFVDNTIAVSSTKHWVFTPTMEANFVFANTPNKIRNMIDLKR